MRQILEIRKLSYQSLHQEFFTRSTVPERNSSSGDGAATGQERECRTGCHGLFLEISVQAFFAHLQQQGAYEQQEWLQLSIQ